jgi:hypothetical protein
MSWHEPKNITEAKQWFILSYWNSPHLELNVHCGTDLCVIAQILGQSLAAAAIMLEEKIGPYT